MARLLSLQNSFILIDYTWAIWSFLAVDALSGQWY